MLHFKSNARYLRHPAPHTDPFSTTVFTEEQIKNEPMFFNWNAEQLLYTLTVLENQKEISAPITIAFLKSALHYVSRDAVFDSRVHMLMKGWYPCIPGWHHDDVWRNPDLNGQPDYKNMPYKSRHIMGLVNGKICPTLFAATDVSVEEPRPGNIVYEQWHKEIERQIFIGKEIAVREIAEQRLFEFSWEDFHRGQAAKENGWRWFGRLSMNTDRTRTTTNEFRRQVQVYLENPNKGW